jgi:hypothetical protein
MYKYVESVNVVDKVESINILSYYNNFWLYVSNFDICYEYLNILIICT